MRPSFSSQSSLFNLSLACVMCALLSGCSLSSSGVPTVDAGVAISGKVMGGQQAIVGAQVYLFAANTTGYGGAGIAASSSNASASLLTSGSGRTLDTSGGPTNGDYYVTTDSNGLFSITGGYSCTAGQQVYLYALGGNPGSGANSAAGLLEVLGNCPGGTSAFAAADPNIVINEVTTVAAAYAFAGFATDAVHVSSGGTALAKTGIANAFANAANLANIVNGAALAATPMNNGAVPQQEIYTLANILASCVNTSGPSSGNCSTLLSSATADGTPTGAQPTDTATAAINMAHNPGANITALYGLSTATPPFVGLSGQPNDFTVAVAFSGGGLGGAVGIAIDGAGDVWAANEGSSSVSELSGAGVPVSPSDGFTLGGLDFPNGIAIDGLGNVWVSNNESAQGVNGGNGSVTELTSSGAAFSGSPYTGGGVNAPAGLAIDGSGDAWVSDNGTSALSEFSPGGAVQSGPFTGGGLSQPYGIAIDGSGAAWAVSFTTVSKFTRTGTVFGSTDDGINGAFAITLDGSGHAWVTNAFGNSISTFSNSVGTILLDNNYIGGGLNEPIGIAVDGAGSVWAANEGGNSISEFSSSGSAISPSTGYAAGNLVDPRGLAIDGSGNVWVTSGGGVDEIIGVAVPVITPICAGLPATPTGNGTSTLGTRP